MRQLFGTFFIVLMLFTSNSYAAEEKPSMKKEDRPVMVIETNRGVIEVVLFQDIAPKAVENFTTHAKNKYYDGTVFHRVIKNFMIQGGDPLGTGTGGESIWKTSFEDEFSPTLLFTKPGLLAMANRGPKTNGSQFFITTAATPWLSGKHTIFGEVVGGYDVVQKIESTQTGPSDKPIEPQKILSIHPKKQS